MPLEMFDGRTGPRLIARLPVEPTELATLTLADGSLVTVFHPPGLLKDGYPALSPVTTTLPQAVRVSIQSRYAWMLHDLEGFLSQLDEAEATTRRLLAARMASPGVNQHPLSPVMAALRLATFGLERSMAENARPAIEKLPVCTSIGVGRTLSLRLSSIYGELRAIELGRITAVDIIPHPSPVG